MQDDRVLAAAENNARWCDLVCRSHAIPTAWETGHWAALRRPPEHCPDAVTLLPSATAADALRSAQDGPGCTLTDSFASLDLAALGFEELFESQWIFRIAALPSVTAATIWWRVESDEEFAAWAQAAGAVGTLPAELLRDPAVRILTARGPGGAVQAGAIASLSGSVVGVSNVFTSRAMTPDRAWFRLATDVARHFPGVPLVGHAHGEDLQAALDAGFVALGSLRVWARPGERAGE